MTDSEMQEMVENVFGGILACDPEVYAELKREFCQTYNCEESWLDAAINKINFEEDFW